MGAGTWKVYGRAKKSIGNGQITLGTGVFKMCLLKNSASSAKSIGALSSRSTWASLRSAEISARGGYQANGRVLPSVSALAKWVSVSAKTMKFTYTTGGLIFTASGSPLNGIRYAVIRNSTSSTGGKLVCYVTLSTIGAFTITNPNTLTILPAANGVFTMS